MDVEMLKSVASATCGLLLLSGCSAISKDSPVFGAVFGVSGAAVTPYTPGKIPEPQSAPGDREVGKAANNPGLCIWETKAGNRFRADCAA